MDLHSEELLNQYKSKLPQYQIIRDVVLTKLNEIVDSLGIIPNSITGRIKTEDSLIGKLDLKGTKYKDISDITDIVGCRVVTFYTNEIDLVAAKISTSFTIDWDNSIDKRKVHKIDQFGYSSLHYICSIPKSLYDDPNNPLVNSLKFEIQIRTVLQHAWASIYHDTGYKNDVEVPSEYLRSLNRLAGLLEIADMQFEEIKTSLNQYRKKIKELVASGSLDEVEVNVDSYLDYVNTGRFDQLNNQIASINNMDIEKVSLRDLLPAFKHVGFTTLKDLEDLVRDYSDLAYKFCILQFEDTDLDIISSMTGPVSLLFVYCLAKGYSEEQMLGLLELIYGVRRSNNSYAKHIIKLGKTMGLIKE